MNWTTLVIIFLAFLGICLFVTGGASIGRGGKLSSPGVVIPNFCGLVFLGAALLMAAAHLRLSPPEVYPVSRLVKDDGTTVLEESEIVILKRTADERGDPVFEPYPPPNMLIRFQEELKSATQPVRLVPAAESRPAATSAPASGSR